MTAHPWQGKETQDQPFTNSEWGTQEVGCDAAKGLGRSGTAEEAVRLRSKGGGNGGVIWITVIGEHGAKISVRMQAFRACILIWIIERYVDRLG